jgi:long-chain acyl-CoA synthetase
MTGASDTLAAGPRTTVPDLSPSSLGEMLLEAAARYRGVALEYRRNGKPISITYPELGAQTSEIARGLIALGLRAGDRVAIFAATSAAWTLADFGSLCAGAVVVPIYHTSSVEECAYVLDNSGASVVFCGDTEQASKVAQARAQHLKHVIMLDGAADGAITLSELRDHGRGIASTAISERLATRTRKDLATLVYTSGTTGPPKGCMLTHENLLDTARIYIDELGLNETHSLYQFLPLAHVLARVAQATVLGAGARCCFWSGDSSKIIEELGEFEPTHFPAVPRIYEKIHGAVVGRIEDGPALQRALFWWAIRTGQQAREQHRAGRTLGRVQRAKYGLADRLVLGKVRSLFGNRLQLALVGAAPVAPEILRFFDACGLLVLEGYGLTESCAVATLNTPQQVRFGTVGKPLPGTEVTIADDGEIMLRGPQIFSGYYRDSAATEEAISADRRLHTGDLGTVTSDGFVMITGRKKDLIITSSGKNITPVNVESGLRETRYISEAVVFGDNRPYLVAIVTLDHDEIARLSQRLGIEPETAADDPRVRAEIQRNVDAVNQRLARIEQIKHFAILDHDLTQASGELTPTMKVKRAFVYEKYADLFAGLYESGATP